MRGAAGQRGIHPKAIGNYCKVGCMRTPCFCSFSHPGWFIDLVVKYAPNDTVLAGGPQWAAHMARLRPDGPKDEYERGLSLKYPKHPVFYSDFTPAPGSAASDFHSTRSASASQCASSAASDYGGPDEAHPPPSGEGQSSGGPAAPSAAYQAFVSQYEKGPTDAHDLGPQAPNAGDDGDKSLEPLFN